MSDNIQTNTTGRLTPCLQQKIDKTRYLAEVHFSDTSIQSVKDKLKRVILHDLEHGYARYLCYEAFCECKEPHFADRDKILYF